MKKIGIECENIEDKGTRYGVGQMTLNLLREYSKNPEWQSRFELYLYFKCQIPDDDFLKNPLFKKRVMRVRSFNIFYHILMPIRAMFDRLDWMFFPNYMLPPLYLRKSMVVLTNDIYYEYKQGAIPFRYKLAYRLFSNWAAKRATKILTISEASKKEVIKLFKIKPEKVFVSHLGIEINPKSEIRNPKQILSSDFILYVGQMFPRRHAKETILAFEKISSEFPGLKLILVGKDKYNPPTINETIKDKNNIIHYDYLESRKDIEHLYARARLLVYVSDYEAFGLPPVEAAALGTPVVVKDLELNHELFADAAFFAKDGSAEGIAAALKEGLTNENKRNYCKEKYKELITKFTWKNFAQKVLTQLS